MKNFRKESGRPQRPSGSQKPFAKRSRPAGSADESTGSRKGSAPRESTFSRPANSRYGDAKPSAQKRAYSGSDGADRPYTKKYSEKSSSRFSESGGKASRPAGARKNTGENSFGEKRPFTPRTSPAPRAGGRTSEFPRPFDQPRAFEKKRAPGVGVPASEAAQRRHIPAAQRPEKPVLRARKGRVEKDAGGLIRLNRYIANAGICSRRKADELIQAGVITVNGAVVDELGFKVDPARDEIRYNGEMLKREKKVYVLLNKPKDYLTTTEDPHERRTVMQLVHAAGGDRIYPVGRLDRNTTGLLLLTNDGDLAEKLSHPRNNVTKIYHVELSRNLTQGDFNKIAYGVELEDGFIKPDDLSYVLGASKREVGIQIHSGRNRIVRRIFEHLGYEVVKLDRTIYANLTKKDLPRGRWRYLEEKELIQLKHFVL